MSLLEQAIEAGNLGTLCTVSGIWYYGGDGERDISCGVSLLEQAIEAVGNLVRHVLSGLVSM